MAAERAGAAQEAEAQSEAAVRRVAEAEKAEAAALVAAEQRRAEVLARREQVCASCLPD